MTKEEMKNRISMALKDPILQQGFEIICKNLAKLESRNDNLVKWYNKRSESDNSFQQSLYKNIEELEKENAELKEKLTRAKEIIRELLNSCFGYNSKTVNYEARVKAEQFLKEVSE